MRRRTSPVQQWVDSLPSPSKSTTSSIGSIVRQQSVSVDSESALIPECTVEHVYSEKENFVRHSNMTVSTPISVPSSPAVVRPGISRLARDPSFQSDSSHCSSVESLLELRRADPEAVLLSLGFGGCSNSPQDAGPLSRIPKRFLQPSRLKGIAIDDFVKHQQETSESLDSTSLGYRGLTGSPYVAPSEIVQKIMQRLREHENHEMQEIYSTENNFLPQQQEGRLSVLSPDNRQFLDRPRSKSPDMRNKRMIIGQRSFAFGRNGDLIEIKSRSVQSSSQESDEVFEFSSEPSTTKDLLTTEQMKSTGPTNRRLEFETTRISSSSSSSLNSPKLNSTETVISIQSTHRNNNNTDKNYNQIESTNPRRASVGDDNSSKSEEEARRFSDSQVEEMKKNDVEPCSLDTKKKCVLKRQARIDDDDNVDNICVHCGKPQKDDDDEADVSCCYKRTSQSCWREMEKVLQKNKKLEDVVNKSRREMAEIRDMLSSVLSVRMEPGF